MKHYTSRFLLGKLVTVCPRCGHRSFKPYLDRATGEPLDVNVCGRCNHENSCRYHLRPSEWFASGGRVPAAVPGWTPPPPPDPDFLNPTPEPTVESLRNDALYRFLCSRFGEEKVIAAFRLYRVHHARWHGGATAFFLIDSEGRSRSAKLMRYGDDGHRIRSDNPAFNVSYLHAIKGVRSFRYRACFLGEHIAAARPGAAICLVESEKTALIMACRENSGRYAYLATGGCSALKPRDTDRDDPYSRFGILRDRRVILYPDADMIAKWRDVAEALRPFCRSVRLIDVRLPPYSLTASEDIGDWLLGFRPCRKIL